MCRRDLDEMGKFSQKPFFTRLHRGPGKGPSVPLYMVVNIGCTSKMMRTNILLVHTEIRKSQLSSHVYQLMAHNIQEETKQDKHCIL
jgi:hypothetical protein